MPPPPIFLVPGPFSQQNLSKQKLVYFIHFYFYLYVISFLFEMGEGFDFPFRFLFFGELCILTFWRKNPPGLENGLPLTCPPRWHLTGALGIPPPPFHRLTTLYSVMYCLLLCFIKVNARPSRSAFITQRFDIPFRSAVTFSEKTYYGMECQNIGL